MKDSAKELLNNPAVKLVGLVASQVALGCSLYYGLRAEIREHIATQTGVDNVQNVQIQQVKESNAATQSAVNALQVRFDRVVSREGTKPDPIRVEQE